MTDQPKPEHRGNTSKRQELIRETIARSRQFSSDLNEIRKWPGWTLLANRAKRFFGQPESPSSSEPVPQTPIPGIMDPVRFKRILTRIIKILILWELGGALLDGLSGHGWGRFTNDAIIAIILFLAWGRIILIVERKRIEYKKRMEVAPGKLKIKDALVFSLLWSDEIFSNIPPDRRRIATISYSLIAAGIVVAVLHIGGSTLMPLILSGALVLGAVNLLIWVVSLERGEKESLQTELRLAHEVQDSLMPIHPPVFEGFDVAGMSLSAKEVGGDLFDYACPNADAKKLALAVVDVSGKGMKAAMSAVFTSGAYAAEIRSCDSPARVLTQLNKAVYAHTRRGNFVAFLLMVLDSEKQTVTMANAGQTKPLLKSNGTVQWLNCVGVNFGLGMKEDALYSECTFDLRSGDVLIMLTDGFTEAMNILREPYGPERMAEFMKSFNTDRLTAQQILEILLTEVRAFTGAASQHDDMTMIVVKMV